MAEGESPRLVYRTTDGRRHYRRQKNVSGSVYHKEDGMDYGRIYGYGWESMPPPPKKPFYLIQAENRCEKAEQEWLALTDIEPVPYEQADAALKRLQKAEADLAAARERDYGERMTNAFVVEAKNRQLRVEWTFNATREMVATENH